MITSPANPLTDVSAPGVAAPSDQFTTARDLRVAATVAQFFARVERTNPLLRDVHRAMRLLDRDASDVLVLHHCLGVSLRDTAHRLDMNEAVAVGLLAQAEAAVAPVIAGN